MPQRLVTVCRWWLLTLVVLLPVQIAVAVSLAAWPAVSAGAFGYLAALVGLWAAHRAGGDRR